MSFAEQDLVKIVQTAWESTLQMDAIQAAGAVDISEPNATGVVQITGAWQGAIMVRCSSPLAQAIAASMFGVEPDCSSPDEVRDALGEMVNVIAGNFKALLPVGCQLSMPTVVEGRDYQLAVPGSSAVMNLRMETTGRPFEVGVLIQGHRA
jgi:chemotaxis protein CheX